MSVSWTVTGKALPAIQSSGVPYLPSSEPGSHVSPENKRSNLAADVESTWNAIEPDFPFTYSFLNESFDIQYQSEEKFGKIIIYFSMISILIACLGLFGLAKFMSTQRTKEIGIRKVLGSTVFGVIKLLTKEYSKWLIIASIIACPLGWFFASNWLHNFAFKTNISWWVFALSITISIIIAFVTVIYQSIKVATHNPAKSLKYE